MKKSLKRISVVLAMCILCTVLVGSIAAGAQTTDAKPTSLTQEVSDSTHHIMISVSKAGASSYSVFFSVAYNDYLTTTEIINFSNMQQPLNPMQSPVFPTASIYSAGVSLNVTGLYTDVLNDILPPSGPGSGYTIALQPTYPDSTYGSQPTKALSVSYTIPVEPEGGYQTIVNVSGYGLGASLSFNVNDLA